MRVEMRVEMRVDLTIYPKHYFCRIHEFWLKEYGGAKSGSTSKQAFCEEYTNPRKTAGCFLYKIQRVKEYEEVLTKHIRRSLFPVLLSKCHVVSFFQRS